MADSPEITNILLLKQNFGEQLIELEMLQSMFPSPEELMVEDPLTTVEMADFVSGTCQFPAPESSLVLRLRLGELEAVMRLPRYYPRQGRPEIYLRSEKLHREAQSELNVALESYLAGTVSGEPVLIEVVAWLQERCSQLLSQPVAGRDASNVSEHSDGFARYWIYSHHIYSKSKRRDLLGLAEQLRLTGFCLPGKPGIICVEGRRRDCGEWWSLVKRQTWQRITLKHSETKEDEQDVDSSRLFSDFKEIGELKSGTRMDMGWFQRFLHQHGVDSHIFGLLLSLDQ